VFHVEKPFSRFRAIESCGDSAGAMTEVNTKIGLREDERKSKARLIDELRAARRKIAVLERAKDALKVDEGLYRLLFENCGDAVLLTKPDGTISAANPEACRMFGRSEKEIIKIGRAGIADSKDPRVPAAIEERCRTGQFKGEFNCVKKNGVVFPCDVTSTIFKDSSGNERSVTILRDLTEHKRAEEIIQSLSKFPAENPNPILRIARDGTLLYCNQAGLILLPEWHLQLGQAAPPMLRGAAFQVMDSGSPQTVDFEHGQRVYSLFVPPVVDASYVNLYGRDVTERKRAEEALRYQAVLLADTYDAIVASDEHYRLTAWNAAAESLYGWKAEEVLGRFGLDITQTEFPGVEKSEMLRTITEIGHWRGEVTQARKDGTRISVEVATIVLHDESGRITGYLSVNRDIAERKRAEEALRKSEEKYRGLTENINLGIYRNTIGPKGEFMEANPAIIGMFGYQNKGEFLAICVSDLYQNPEDRNKFTEKMVKEGFVRGEELRLKKKDGSLIVGSVSTVAVKDEQGHVTHYDGIIDDITERKRVEARLVYQASLLKNVNDAVISADEKTIITSWNKAAERIYGWKAEEALGRNGDELLRPEFGSFEPSDVSRQLNEIGSFRGEIIQYCKDGTPVSIETNIMALKDEQGRPNGFVGINRDITERKRAEEALRENEERFRELFNRISSGVAVYEAVDNGGDFIFRDFNPAAEKIENVSRKDILGKRVSEAFSGVKAFGVFEVFQRVWQTGKPEYFPENIYKDKRDPGSWRESWIFKLPTGEIVAIYNDVTERKRAEEALRKSESNLRALAIELSRAEERERQRLALFLHDEIGQSLSLLRMKFGSLAEAAASKASKRDLQKARDLLENVINQTHTLTFELNPPVLYQLGLEAAIEWAGEKISHDNGIEFMFSDDGRMKPLDDDLKALLFRCARELMMNVVKHAKARRMTVSLTQREERVFVVMEDDGIGFETSLLESQPAQIGFGLFSVRERLAAVDGTFEIRSEPGRGTRVTLSVPLKKEIPSNGVS
jgi:PAS domain S-box-containing protein